VSCPRLALWNELLAARRGHVAGGVLSAEQREHLAACAECRRAAVEGDASLAFVLALASGPAQGAAAPDVEAMRQAVRGAVRDITRDSIRAARGRASTFGSESRLAGLRRRGLGWKGVAAAGLAALALLMRPSLLPTAVSPDPMVPVAAAAALPVAKGLAGASSLASFASSPLIEDLDGPNARIYELADRPGDVSVVLIVDESLEI
jgi:hypothetical protein